MGEFVAKKYDNTSHMVWWNGHGMICRTDSLGNAARIADALNAQAAPPAALADDFRAKVRAVTASLRDREWADDLSETDPEVLDLREQIAELIGQAQQPAAAKGEDFE